MYKGCEFINFEPTRELEQYAQSRLLELVELAPYDAMATSTLERDAISYSCRVEILSRWGIFLAHSLAQTPAAALDRAARHVHSQIARWQAARTGGLKQCLA